MLSVHRVRDVPQFISTSRHVMHGFLDLVGKPGWEMLSSGLLPSCRHPAREFISRASGRRHRPNGRFHYQNKVALPLKRGFMSSPRTHSTWPSM